MINPKLARSLRNLLPLMHRDLSSRFSPTPFASHHDRIAFHLFQSRPFTLHKSNSSFSFVVFGFHHSVYRPPKISSSFNPSFASHHGYSTTTNASTEDIQCQNSQEPPHCNALYSQYLYFFHPNNLSLVSLSMFACLPSVRSKFCSKI